MITSGPAGIATGRAAFSTQGHVATVVAAGLELALSVMPVARPLFGNPRARAPARPRRQPSNVASARFSRPRSTWPGGAVEVMAPCVFPARATARVA